MKIDQTLTGRKIHIPNGNGVVVCVVLGADGTSSEFLVQGDACNAPVWRQPVAAPGWWFLDTQGERDDAETALMRGEQVSPVKAMSDDEQDTLITALGCAISESIDERKEAKYKELRRKVSEASGITLHTKPVLVVSDESRRHRGDTEFALPDHLQRALRDYGIGHHETGGFLRACLENDLRRACEKADLENRRRIFEIVSFIYDKLPAACWGSPAKVAAWLAGPKTTDRVDEPGHEEELDAKRVGMEDGEDDRDQT